jgi:aminopeptidase YwaD
MKDIEGEKLLVHAGRQVGVVSHAKRVPETAFNVTARRDERIRGRIVVTAHVDTKIGTPGAIDNATGVAAVLALAELLKDDPGRRPVELVVFNGEDYYGAPGQVRYVERNAGRFGDIALNINIDGAGYKEGLSCFSPFALPENIQGVFNTLLRETPEITGGLPWYQGDHSLFLQNGCPAIAVSSQWFIENMECQQITHTPADNPGVVDCRRVAQCAAAIAELIRKI